MSDHYTCTFPKTDPIVSRSEEHRGPGRRPASVRQVFCVRAGMGFLIYEICRKLFMILLQGKSFRFSMKKMIIKVFQVQDQVQDDNKKCQPGPHDRRLLDILRPDPGTPVSHSQEILKMIL